jgi:hypothetical protein
MIHYYISYKGKKLGAPMSKLEAEEKLIVLSRCFKQLEVVCEKSPLSASSGRETEKIAGNQ